MFSDFELSKRGGKPRHLFVFTRQMKTWRFASGQKDVPIGGNVYNAAPIERSEIKETVEKPQDQITITFPYVRDPSVTDLPVTQELGDNWHPYMPSDVVKVICMAYHANDPDLQAIIQWQGRVSQPKFTKGKLELTCIPTSTRSANLRRAPKWQRNCWKATYSTGLRGCNLVRADFAIAATITAIDGLTLSAAEFATSTFNLGGGELSWTRTDGIVERRPIMSHSGTDITILYPGKDLAVGLAVTVLPDCPRTWQACVDRDNTDNYGGSVYEPIDDAFGGESMSWG